jgi:glucose/arabinose dehydrogenase
MNRFIPTQPVDFTIEEAFPNLNFNQPVGIYNAGDGTNRLFVVEQSGIIYVFDNSQNVTSAIVFLDIRDRVNDEGYEEGLLGLAFHPNYKNNGYLYVDYTTANPKRTVIARYQIEANNPDRANKNSEYVILEVEQPFSNHNGGQISFGPDGNLYIALGDGGAGGDPQGNGQNLQTLLGSILRIDVDNPSNGKNYGIPNDNPFVGNPNALDEIYAYGLRNPWRFSFDPETDWLWTGDVGQNKWEEIDIIERGKNYGWNVMEGKHCFEPSTGCSTSDLELPIWEYGRDEGHSVTGGFVYRGTMIPQLIGSYIYGDFEFGSIWSLQYDGTGNPVNTLLFETDYEISSFGVDENNELYICDWRNGRIYTFVIT